MLEDFERMSKELEDLIEVLSAFPEKGAKVINDNIKKAFSSGHLANVRPNKPSWVSEKQRIYNRHSQLHPSGRGTRAQSGVFTGTMYSTINFTRNNKISGNEVVANVGVLDTNAVQPTPAGNPVADYVPKFELYARKSATLNGHPVTAVIGYYVVSSLGDVKNMLMSVIPRRIKLDKEGEMIAIK